MKNINEYKTRFNILMESEMGDVKPLIMEANPGDAAPLEQLPKEIQDFVKRYNLSGNFNYASVSGKIGVEFGYNKGNRHSSIGVSDIQTYEANKEKLSQCQERSKFYSDTYNNLMTGTNTQQDPRMQQHCKRDPNHPACRNQGGGRMDNYQAQSKAAELMNQKYPNMEFCSAVESVQNIINMK